MANDETAIAQINTRMAKMKESYRVPMKLNPDLAGAVRKAHARQGDVVLQTSLLYEASD